jgi:hypothetical protein
MCHVFPWTTAGPINFKFKLPRSKHCRPLPTGTIDAVSVVTVLTRMDASMGVESALGLFAFYRGQ